MHTTQINLIFIRSLSEKYETFYHSISKDIHMMSTIEVFTWIKVIDALYAKPDESKLSMFTIKLYKRNGFHNYKGKEKVIKAKDLLETTIRFAQINEITAINFPRQPRVYPC